MRSFATRLAPLKGMAIALIVVAAVFWWGGRTVSESSVRGLFVGLAALAVPHIMLHLVADPTRNPKLRSVQRSVQVST